MEHAERYCNTTYGGKSDRLYRAGFQDASRQHRTVPKGAAVEERGGFRTRLLTAPHFRSAWPTAQRTRGVRGPAVRHLVR